MNSRPVILLLCAVAGFASGWLMPTRDAPAPDKSIPPITSETRRRDTRELRHKQILTDLMEDHQMARYKMAHATTLSGKLAALRKVGWPDPDDLLDLLDREPEATLTELILNGETSAIEQAAGCWARKDAPAAIQFLRSQTSYNAESALTAALLAAYPTQPELVAETLRLKGRHWQARNLTALFKPLVPVDPDPAPKPRSTQTQPPSEDDPFADNNFDFTPSYDPVALAKLLSDSLADDELRSKAREILETRQPSETEVTAKPADQPTDTSSFDPANFNNDSIYSGPDREKLQALFKDDPDHTLEWIAAEGNLAARQCALYELMPKFAGDQSTWPADLEKLGKLIEKLGVIPDHPPSHFEMGPYLRGPVVAQWIEEQPVALQRAWASTFTETWAESDPRAAIGWALTLPPAANGDVAVQRSLIIWSHKSPQEAAAYVKELPPGDLREAAISNTAATWSCLDPAAARAWLNTLPASPGKSWGMERIR